MSEVRGCAFANRAVLPELQTKGASMNAELAPIRTVATQLESMKVGDTFTFEFEQLSAVRSAALRLQKRLDREYVTCSKGVCTIKRTK